MTELLLLTLIFAGLPLVSRADEHVTMDFIDRPARRARPAIAAPRASIWCAALILIGLAWRVYIKAGKIAGYGDTTDVLRIPVGPFVYFMALMVAGHRHRPHRQGVSARPRQSARRSIPTR